MFFANFAIAMHKAGGLAVLNLEGVWTKYDDPTSILEEVASASRDERARPACCARTTP